MITDVGYLGLGQMGSAIAERLLNQPWRLHVHDPAPGAMQRFVEAGAVAHDSARSVADVAPIVFACLPNPAVSLAVALGEGGVSQGKAVKVYAEMSTIGREVIERIEQGLRPAGITALDAPVTGGPPAARAGRLTLLVSGESQAVAQVHPLLALMGSAVHVLGERAGLAQIMKVVNNTMLGAHMVVASEVLDMGARAGLDPTTMLEVLRSGTGQSFAGCEILRRPVQGHYDFGAALNVLVKDMALGVHEAEALGLSMPVIERSRATWDAAQAAGWGDRDFTTILPFVRGDDRPA